MSEEYMREGDVNYDPYNAAHDSDRTSVAEPAKGNEGDVNYDPYNGDGAGTDLGSGPGAVKEGAGAGDGRGAEAAGGGRGFAGDRPAAAKIPGARLPGREETASLRLAGTEDRKVAELTPEQEAVMGYDQQMEVLRAAAASIKVETPEQRKKRARLERSRKIIGAVTDGLSAFANLYFTTKGAPNVYNPQHSTLGRATESIEKARVEREAEADRYNNIMLRIGDIQTARARTLREMAAQNEARELARKKAEQEAEEHDWMAAIQPDVRRERKGKADKAESDAVSALYEAENKPEELRLKNSTEIARANSYRASATASYASAENSRMSAAATRQRMDQDKGEKPYAYDSQGNKHYFEKESTAEAYARSQGTWEEYEVRKKTIETEEGDSIPRKTTETVETRGYSKKPETFNPEDYRRDKKTTTPPPLN